MKSLLFLPLLIAWAWNPATEPDVASTAKQWSVDSSHSTVIFRVKHVGASYFYGRFNLVEGGIVYDKDDPESLSVDIRVRADSIDTNDERRDRHLKSSDFFSAAEYEWITFKSESVTATDGVFEIQGELEMRGEAKPVTVKATYSGEGNFQGKDRIGFEMEFSIKRSDFGVSYGVEQGVLGDEVRLIGGFEFIDAG